MITAIFLFTLIYIIACGNLQDALWLESPRITPWGQFGPKEFCPSNSFVSGMRLKTDQEHFGDNTALNAVELVCTNLYAESKTIITSSKGRFGNYGKFKYCRSGFATGFQLRSQNGQGFLRDDVAAVDFELICTDINGSMYHLKDKDNEVLTWGYWTLDQHCPSMTVVCGISTQLENLDVNLESKDETSLNNVDIACCSLSAPIETCVLHYYWETLIACPKKTVTCPLKLSTGIVENKRLAKFRKFYEKNGNVGKFHAHVKQSLKVKAENFSEKINNNSIKSIIHRTKMIRKIWSLNIQCEGIIQQLVVTCGFLKLYVFESRCVPDQYAKQEWESDGFYFQPTTHSETILWSYNCDFTGGNLANQTSEIADCGNICLSNEECTHFVWNQYNGGTCWLKGSETLATPVERYNENVLCGWVERS